MATPKDSLFNLKPNGKMAKLLKLLDTCDVKKILSVLSQSKKRQLKLREKGSKLFRRAVRNRTQPHVDIFYPVSLLFQVTVTVKLRVIFF